MKNSKGFTLAEVVITLIVIGVVSAITIPMLNNNVDDKKWNVARQKAQATIGEAFKLATVNGYVTPEYDNTKDFVTKVLTKYLKINKQCDTATACGFSSEIKRADGKSSSAIPTSWTEATYTTVISGANGRDQYGAFNTVNGGVRAKFNNSTFFQTLDGFSVNFFFNPYCAVAENDKYFYTGIYNDKVIYEHYALDVVCMNAVYDMNGKKGPNRVGYDIGFVGSFYNSYGVKATAILPYKYEKPANNANLPGSGSDYWARAQQYCRELHYGDWKMPDINELFLMYVNRNILTQSDNYWYWSSVPLDGSNYNYMFAVLLRRYEGGGPGMAFSRNRDSFKVQCVKTNALK